MYCRGIFIVPHLLRVTRDLGYAVLSKKTAPMFNHLLRQARATAWESIYYSTDHLGDKTSSYGRKLRITSHNITKYFYKLLVFNTQNVNVTIIYYIYKEGNKISQCIIHIHTIRYQMNTD